MLDKVIVFRMQYTIYNPELQEEFAFVVDLKASVAH